MPSPREQKRALGLDLSPVSHTSSSLHVQNHYLISRKLFTAITSLPFAKFPTPFERARFLSCCDILVENYSKISTLAVPKPTFERVLRSSIHSSEPLNRYFLLCPTPPEKNLNSNTLLAPSRANPGHSSPLHCAKIPEWRKRSRLLLDILGSRGKSFPFFARLLFDESGHIKEGVRRIAVHINVLEDFASPTGFHCRQPLNCPEVCPLSERYVRVGHLRYELKTCGIRSLRRKHSKSRQKALIGPRFRGGLPMVAETCLIRLSDLVSKRLTNPFSLMPLCRCPVNNG